MTIQIDTETNRSIEADFEIKVFLPKNLKFKNPTSMVSDVPLRGLGLDGLRSSISRRRPRWSRIFHLKELGFVRPIHFLRI
jgi:hypothetical protein